MLLVALCCATAYVTLRRSTRARIARLSPKTVLCLCALAALPWVIIHFGMKHIAVSAHSSAELIGLFALALLAFALLVLLPLAVAISILVWMFARSGR